MNQCPNCWGYQEYNEKEVFPATDKKKKTKLHNEYSLLGMILSK